MNKVIEIFNQIQNTSSKNDKIKIVRENKDNEVFIESLKFLLDTSKVTGISTSKLKKKLNANMLLNMELFVEVDEWIKLMNYLVAHNTGSDVDIRRVRGFILKVNDPDHKTFYEQMVTKKLKIGMDVKSANKAIPGLIYNFSTQQGYPLDDKNKPKTGEKFFLSRKLNGVNVSWLDGKWVSRQGKEIKNLEHLTYEIELLGLENLYVNGELIRNNHDNLPDDENFQLTCSIANSDMKDKSELDLIFYEAIPTEEFYIGESTEKYSKRLERYKRIQQMIDRTPDVSHIHLVERVYEGTDQSKIQELLNEADGKGWEGLMLNKDDVWHNKRNNSLLKIKTFHTCDLRCLRVEEGEGKFSGTLGKIVCNYKGFELGVGSGFDDAARKYYWEHPEEIVGKIVQVKYKAKTKNQNGGESLQFPIYQCVRDKEEESYE